MNKREMIFVRLCFLIYKDDLVKYVEKQLYKILHPLLFSHSFLLVYNKCRYLNFQIVQSVDFYTSFMNFRIWSRYSCPP